MNVPAKTTSVGELAEGMLIEGDYSKFTPEERVKTILKICKSLGLNPITRPIRFIKMPNGQVVPYATRDCADQLRKIYAVSIEITKEAYSGDGLYRVHSRARMPDGRTDEDRGVVAIPEKMAGEFRANLELKAVTKAKRRVTLSICGLGFLDETEVDDIPDTEEADDEQRELPPMDEISELSADEAGGQIVEHMGREAAMRGKDIFDKFYAAQTKEGKERLRAIKPELEKLFPAERQK